MKYRSLGRTGLSVSAISMGAGPVPALMTSDNIGQAMFVLRHAIDAGINWFDTAASYGNGKSEETLGQLFQEFGSPTGMYLATKVRLDARGLDDIRASVRASVVGSVQRLRGARIAVLQLHNAITACRGDQPTSITPDDVLGPGGVWEAFDSLRREGVIEHLGLTGLGQPEALREVISSGRFDTLQIPYNVLNPSAGRAMPQGATDPDYGDLVSDCARQEMGVFAMRVLAGGALAGCGPSEHTKTTPFFPLDLFRRDQQQAAELTKRLPPGMSLKELAVRFALTHPNIASAIIGFNDTRQIDELIRYSSSV